MSVSMSINMMMTTTERKGRWKGTHDDDNIDDDDDDDDDDDESLLVDIPVVVHAPEGLCDHEAEDRQPRRYVRHGNPGPNIRSHEDTSGPVRSYKDP